MANIKKKNGSQPSSRRDEDWQDHPPVLSEEEIEKLRLKYESQKIHIARSAAIDLSKYVYSQSRISLPKDKEQQQTVDQFKAMHLDNVAQPELDKFEPIKKGMARGAENSNKYRKEDADSDLLSVFQSWQKNNRLSIFKDGVLLDTKKRIKAFKLEKPSLTERQKKRLSNLQKAGKIPDPN